MRFANVHCYYLSPAPLRLLLYFVAQYKFLVIIIIIMKFEMLFSVWSESFVKTSITKRNIMQCNHNGRFAMPLNFLFSLHVADIHSHFGNVLYSAFKQESV